MPKDVDLGVLKSRDVREIWPNEARDFTVGGHFKSGQAGPGQNRPVIQ